MTPGKSSAVANSLLCRDGFSLISEGEASRFLNMRAWKVRLLIAEGSPTQRDPERFSTTETM